MRLFASRGRLRRRLWSRIRLSTQGCFPFGDYNTPPHSPLSFPPPSSIPAKAGISAAIAAFADRRHWRFRFAEFPADAGRDSRFRGNGRFFYFTLIFYSPHSHLFHSRESGNLPVCWGGASNACAASVCNLRRWRWNREIPAFAGMGRIFLFHAYFLPPALSPLPFPRKRESPCLLRRGEQRSRRFGL